MQKLDHEIVWEEVISEDDELQSVPKTLEIQEVEDSSSRRKEE